MAVSAATLAGHRVTNARAYLPKWGCWYAEVAIDGEHTIKGAIDLKIADLTLHGTIISGGPAKGRSDYRVVAGFGGWGKIIAEKAYANDAGVKLSTVLGDAASAVGEKLDTKTIPATRIGPAWTRPKDPAARVLELVAANAWYVGEDGITRLGKRPSSPLVGAVTHGKVDRARGTVTLAGESIAKILPGVVVDGLEAVDVVHEISAKGGLRSIVWGALASSSSRRLAAFRAILEQSDPFRRFRGVTEYRIVSQAGERLNLQPVQVSTGMPNLLRVPVRAGISGFSSIFTPGSRVLVAFINADPGRPTVTNFEDAEGTGFVPLEIHIEATLIKLGQGILPAIRATDLAGGIWPCVPSQVQVLI